MQAFKSITIIALLISLLWCKQGDFQYPQNRSISNSQGQIKDSLLSYFTITNPLDSSQAAFLNDTLLQAVLSANLFAFKEPVLFNDYLGYEIYRFLYLSSVELPLVFTLVKKDGQVTLTTKQLDRDPLITDKRERISPYSDSIEKADGTWLNADSLYKAYGYTVLYEYDTSKRGVINKDMIVKADRKAFLKKALSKDLTNREWEQFEQLLTAADYWRIPSFEVDGSTDGAYWVIEAHNKNRYRYVYRHSPEGKLEQAGLYLATLSGIKTYIGK